MHNNASSLVFGRNGIIIFLRTSRIIQLDLSPSNSRVMNHEPRKKLFEANNVTPSNHKQMQQSLASPSPSLEAWCNRALNNSSQHVHQLLHRFKYYHLSV